MSCHQESRRHCFHAFHCDPSVPGSAEADALVIVDSAGKRLRPHYCCRFNCGFVFLCDHEHEEKTHGGMAPTPTLVVHRMV